MEIIVRRRPKQVLSAPRHYQVVPDSYLNLCRPPKTTFEYLGDRKPVPKLKITQIQTKTQQIKRG